MDTIKLQVGKKEVELPNKLTIRQYQELKTINNFEKNPIEFLSAISGIDQKDIRYANKKDMDFVFRILSQTYMGKQDVQLRTIIKIDDVEYGLMSNIHKLNFGGWVDLEYLTTDGVEKNMHKIMALMYRPITGYDKKGDYIIEEYDHQTLEERAEIFFNAPVEYFWGVSNFFFQLVKVYTDNTKDSLEYQKKKEIAKKRLRMMNPIYHLSKLYHVFTGTALCRYVKKTLQRWKK